MKIISISIAAFLVGIFSYISDVKNTDQDFFSVKTIKTKSIINYDGEVTVIKINKGKMSYKVANKNHRDYDFYVNANYFDNDDKPIGEVIIENREICTKRPHGGFFTSNGKNPKFYFGSRPNNVKFSSQTHTPIINNGVSNNRIFKQKWAKERDARLVVGENSIGDIFVIHTQSRTSLTVKEMNIICKHLSLKNALMFDGGASIEVGIKRGTIEYRYQEFNDFFRSIGNIPKPKIFIVGTFNI